MYFLEKRKKFGFESKTLSRAMCYLLACHIDYIQLRKW